MKDKLVIKKYLTSYDGGKKTLKVMPETHAKVKKLSEDTNRGVNDLAEMLINFALKYVEIEEAKL